MKIAGVVTKITVIIPSVLKWPWKMKGTSLRQWSHYGYFPIKQRKFLLEFSVKSVVTKTILPGILKVRRYPMAKGHHN